MQQPKTLTASATRLVFSLLFLAILLIPALLGWSGLDARTDNPAKQAPWPGLQTDSLLHADYYKSWVQYLRQRLTATKPLSTAKNWIDFRVFAMTEAQGVHVGSRGWIFDEASVRDYRKSGCREASRIARVIRSLRAAEKIIEASGRRFLFTVAPAKSTIYPEYLGAMPRDPECGSSPYDIMVAALEAAPLESFVRLDRVLVKAKAAQRLLYNPAGTYWNADGARMAAHMMIQQLTGVPLFAPPTDIDDLTSVLMAADPTAARETGPAAADPQQQFSSAVIYGGRALDHLMPHLLPHFRRIDVMSASQLPSMQHDEDLSAYNTVILTVSESQLTDLQINLDPMGRLLDAEALAAARRTVPLNAISAGSKVALEAPSDHLMIKTAGGSAYFSLPPMAGSTADSLRVLQLDVTSPRSDTLYWHSAGGEFKGDDHALRAGPNRLYLPMPLTARVHMRIHLGRNAGIFRLDRATVLTYGKAATDDGPGTGSAGPGLAATSPPQAAIPPTVIPTDDVPPIQVAAPGIALNDYAHHQVFQRRGSAGDIMVSGTYQGAPGAVEAQVVDHDTGAVIMPWTVVDRRPSNGIFIGVLPGVPQGGWYRLAVRFRDRPQIGSQGTAPWGVGMLVACIGQSNMKEWFHSGDDIARHPMLSIHRSGKWTASPTTGNGAGAFAHWLIARLDIPVGLLDYAVNGSGLHPRADWGTGHWAATAPGSIYQQFIQGVAAAGGALEYVVWMQGEADAARRTINGQQYLDVLKAFITRQVRKDIVNGSHKASLPFLVVNMARRPVGADAPHQEIRNALVAATREIDDTYLAATTLDLKTQGRQHLAPEGYTALGRRVAQTILSLLGRSAYYRGPKIESIEKIDAATIDLYLNHSGGDDFQPEENITGFKALSGDTPLAIETVQRLNQSSIRIQLQQPAQGQWRLTYLHGARPDTRGAVLDNSELQLPLEPFEAVID